MVLWGRGVLLDYIRGRRGIARKGPPDHTRSRTPVSGAKGAKRGERLIMWSG